MLSKEEIAQIFNERPRKLYKKGNFPPNVHSGVGMTSRYDIAKLEHDPTALGFNHGDTLEIVGEVVYGQDHCTCRGTFPGAVFTVKGKIGCWISLEAPGYGELGGNYGNGAIFISPTKLLEVAKVISRSNLPPQPENWWT